jgi:hypothetical protein
MSKTEALNAQLDEINQQIADVREQHLILSLTHPLAGEHRRLVSQRKSIESELRKLGHNVIAFSKPRSAVIA